MLSKVRLTTTLLTLLALLAVGPLVAAPNVAHGSPVSGQADQLVPSNVIWIHRLGTWIDQILGRFSFRASPTSSGSTSTYQPGQAEGPQPAPDVSPQSGVQLDPDG